MAFLIRAGSFYIHSTFKDSKIFARDPSCYSQKAQQNVLLSNLKVEIVILYTLCEDTEMYGAFRACIMQYSVFYMQLKPWVINTQCWVDYSTISHQAVYRLLLMKSTDNEK